MENKPTEKQTEKVEPKNIKPSKKEEAVAKLESISASRKVCTYICEFIIGKSIDQAIADLERVTKMKQAVPYRGEIPHRKGQGMMSGRYPVNTAQIFITALKGLKGNVIVNGMDLEKTKIYLAYANTASRPARSGGRKFKRAHVIIKAKEKK